MNQITIPLLGKGWWKQRESNPSHRSCKDPSPALGTCAPMKVTKNCLYCDKEFKADVKELNRGYGLFCSRSCSAYHNAAKKMKPIPNCRCSLCNAPFYRSSTKQSSKSGHLFCSRLCKDVAQRIESEFRDLWPSHYGGARSDYRSIAFRIWDRKCDVCGYDEHPEVIEVHHRDGNRSNNEISNLQPLCPTCHRVAHFKEKGLLQSNRSPS